MQQRVPGKIFQVDQRWVVVDGIFDSLQVSFLCGANIRADSLCAAETFRVKVKRKSQRVRLRFETKITYHRRALSSAVQCITAFGQCLQDVRDVPVDQFDDIVHVHLLVSLIVNDD